MPEGIISLFHSFVKCKKMIVDVIQIVISSVAVILSIVAIVLVIKGK